MTLPEFVIRLKNKLARPLPGLDAQLLMAPQQRFDYRYKERKDGNPQPSAVLILVFRNKGIWSTCYIRRQEYDGVHSGQISFPGGRFEQTDENLKMTALREAGEEVGIDQSKAVIIGKLTPLFIPPSNFLVHPYVAYYPDDPEFTVQKEEVKKTLIVPLGYICDPAKTKSKVIRLSAGMDSETPYYDLDGEMLWGATSMITSEFSQLFCNMI